MRKCGFLGRKPKKQDLPDNHEENRLIGDVRRRALTVVGGFLKADRRHQHPIGCSYHSIFVHPARSALFLPRPHNMAKPVRPLMVSGLAISVAREFDEPIDKPEHP